jgi:hypothetical protein
MFGDVLGRIDSLIRGDVAAMKLGSRTARNVIAGLTRQSIFLRKTLAKSDGYAGQARV